MKRYVAALFLAPIIIVIALVALLITQRQDPSNDKAGCIDLSEEKALHDATYLGPGVGSRGIYEGRFLLENGACAWARIPHKISRQDLGWDCIDYNSNREGIRCFQFIKGANLYYGEKSQNIKPILSAGDSIEFDANSCIFKIKNNGYRIAYNCNWIAH